MALVSTGSESTGSGSFNHVVGPVVGMKVLANPTLKELNDYGVTWFKTAPEYSGKDNDGNTQFVLDIWFGIEGFSYKDKTIEDMSELRSLRFYLKPITRVSQAGNKQFINKWGKCAWENSGNWGTFDQDGMREALDGEEMIHKWLKAFGDFKNTDEMQLTRSKLEKGDFSELIDFVKENQQKKFLALLGIGWNEDKARFTSVVYSKEVWNTWQKPYENGGQMEFPEYVKFIENDQYKMFKKSVFTPGEPMILSTPEVANLVDLPDESEGLNNPADTGTPGTDDLPF